MSEKQKRWSHKEGTKGVDRVRVFERRPGGNLWLEWKEKTGKRHSEAIRLGGRAVKDRTLGILLAKRMSEALLRGRTGSALELLGIPVAHTLRELLDKLHEVKGKTWADSTRKKQVKFRTEWLEWLGADTVLTEIKAVVVDEILNQAQGESGWEPATRNRRARYIVGAFRYAQVKLKWISEAQNLSAVMFLPEDGVGLAYEEWELDLLRQVIDEVDLRLAAAFRIALDTGRRIDAILHLRVENIEIQRVWIDSVGEVELMRITFPGENEKRSKTGWTYVTPETRHAVERLMRTEAVKESGFLFPNRQALSIRPLKNEGAEIRPVASEDFLDYLHKAEALTQEKGLKGPNGENGVEWIKNRGFHGIKRASVTIQASEARNMEIASKQSGTSVEMLQRVYHQAHAEDRAELVINLVDRRERRDRRRNPPVEDERKSPRE